MNRSLLTIDEVTALSIVRWKTHDRHRRHRCCRPNAAPLSPCNISTEIINRSSTHPIRPFKPIITPWTMSLMNSMRDSMFRLRRARTQSTSDHMINGHSIINRRNATRIQKPWTEIRFSIIKKKKKNRAATAAAAAANIIIVVASLRRWTTTTICWRRQRQRLIDDKQTKHLHF